MLRLCQFLAFLATAGCLPAAALSTLDQSTAGYDVVSYNAWQASSFSLAEDAAAFRVRGVTLHLAEIVPNANLVLRITGTTSGRPNNSDVRAAFRIPSSLPATPGTVTFSAAPSPDPFLLPGETYWLVIGMTAPDDEQSLPAGLIRWSYAAGASATTPAAAGWTLGCCTSSSATGGADWHPSPNTPYHFAIEARPTTYIPPYAADGEWSNEGFQLHAVGAPGVEYDIEASIDLKVWQVIHSAFADATGAIHYSDSSNLPSRYFRIR